MMPCNSVCSMSSVGTHPYCEQHGGALLLAARGKLVLTIGGDIQMLTLAVIASIPSHNTANTLLHDGTWDL